MSSEGEPAFYKLSEELLTEITRYTIADLDTSGARIRRLQRLRFVHPKIAYLKIVLKELFPTIRLRPDADRPDCTLDIKWIAPFVRTVIFRPTFHGEYGFRHSHDRNTPLTEPYHRLTLPPPYWGGQSSRGAPRGRARGRGRGHRGRGTRAAIGRLPPPGYSRYDWHVEWYSRLAHAASSAAWNVLRHLPNVREVVVQSPAESRVFSLAVRMLAETKVRPVVLRMQVESGVRDEWYRWNRMPAWDALDLSQLKDLVLTLDTVALSLLNDEDYGEPGSSLDAMLEKCRHSLEHLAIRSNHNELSLLPQEVDSATPSLGWDIGLATIVTDDVSLFKSPFPPVMPHLREIEFCDLQINAIGFASFLTQCLGLSSVSLRDIRIYTGNSVRDVKVSDWRPILDSVRQHVNRIKLDFENMSIPYVEPQLFLRCFTGEGTRGKRDFPWDSWVDNARMDLEEYVSGKGEWTDILDL